jgi:7-dehydrocholesterol reductase
MSFPWKNCQKKYNESFVDIKQWSNCRVGMLGWALLVLIFCVAGIQKNGFSLGPIVNAVLINAYLVKQEW